MRVFHAIVATGLIRVVLWIVLTIGSHRAAQAWVTILPGSFPSTRRTSRNPVLTKPLSMGAPREEFLEDCDADPEGECEVSILCRHSSIESLGVRSVRCCSLPDSLNWTARLG